MTALFFNYDTVTKGRGEITFDNTPPRAGGMNLAFRADNCFIKAFPTVEDKKE